MKVFWRVLGVLALVALVAGGVWMYRQRTVTAQTTTSSASGTFRQIVAASRGNLSSALTVVGQLEAVQREDLAFQKL